tara:strand:- start:30765 stop:31700 length:936 start_codon:yes stop_codon:yes gene_type:complete
MTFRRFNVLFLVAFSFYLAGCKSSSSIYSYTQGFQGKTISIVPNKKGTNSAAFGYQISGLLTEAGFTVLDNLGSKELISTNSDVLGEGTVTVRDKRSENFAKTDLIIESFISRNTCTLRLFERLTNRIIASSSMECVNFPSRQSSIEVIKKLKLIESFEAGTLALHENEIPYSRVKNPELPEYLIDKTITVIPHNFSDIQLEEVLILEKDLVSLGLIVDRLPGGVQEVEIKFENNNDTVTEKYLRLPTIDSDYLILSTPVVRLSYRGTYAYEYVESVTLTLIENKTNMIKSVYSGIPNTSLGLSALLERSH